jgi:hypothetical protein
MRVYRVATVANETSLDGRQYLTTLGFDIEYAKAVSNQ